MDLRSEGCYDLGVWRIMEEGRGWSGIKVV
jgi:hypothetical protein